MKTFFASVFFGRDNRISGAIALFIVALIALGCTCGKGLDLGNLAKNTNSTTTDSSSDDSKDNDAMPSKGLLDAMVAETTADFNYAITADDFSQMYEKASSDFKNTYTEQQFRDSFKEFVDRKRVITPILSKAVSMEPDLSPDPYIRTEQGLEILVVKGKYATKPVPMTFEYEYVKRNDEWRLLKLIVRLV
jgi:hypothetical protein